jgi:hypothetical protein
MLPISMSTVFFPSCPPPVFFLLFYNRNTTRRQSQKERKEFGGGQGRSSNADGHLGSDREEAGSKKVTANLNVRLLFMPYERKNETNKERNLCITSQSPAQRSCFPFPPSFVVSFRSS